MLDMFECLKTGPKDLAMQPNTVGVLVGWAVGWAVGRCSCLCRFVIISRWEVTQKCLNRSTYLAC